MRTRLTIIGGTRSEAKCITCDRVLEGEGALAAAIAHNLPHEVQVIITQEEAASLVRGELVIGNLTIREGEHIRSLANPRNRNAKHFVING